jgi:cell division protein FtsB
VRRPRSAAERRATRGRIIKFTLAFFGCLFVVNALVGSGGLLAVLRARGQYRELETALAQARARNASLARQARRYREDLTAIEEVARRDLGMIKEGERVFIIRDTPAPGAPLGAKP